MAVSIIAHRNDSPPVSSFGKPKTGIIAIQKNAKSIDTPTMASAPAQV
jgi:hypothetical protein